MLEAYKIGIDVAFTSNVTAGLEKIARELGSLDRIVKGSRDGVKLLADDLAAIGKAGASISRLAAAMDRLAEGGGGMSGELKKVADATDSIIGATERLGKVLEANVKLAADMARAINGGRPGAPGAPGGTGHGGGHDLMLTGIAASIVGGTLTGYYAKAIKSGMDAAHLRAIMGADDRVSPADIRAASDQAYAVTRTVPGSTVAGNLGLELDLKQVTGSLPEAVKALPAFAKLVTTLEAIDRRGGGSGDAGFAAAKAVEILGRMTVPDPAHPGQHIIDPAELARNVALITQVAVGTNGRVDPAAYLAFVKQARVGGLALDDQALFRDLPAVIMVTSGSRAGTGEAATYQQFVNGQMTEATANMLKKYGLLDKSAKWENGRVSDMSKHLAGGGEFAANPVQWVRDVLIPDLVKQGITDPVKQAQAVSQFAGKLTTAGFLGDIVRAIAAIDKESGNMAHTRMDSFEMFQANDPSQALRNFDAAFHNLLTALGDASAGDAANVLNAVAKAMDDLADWAKRNPGLAKAITETAGGLGAIATAVGALSTAIFLAGPALKLLGIGTGAKAASAATGGAEVAGAGLLSRFGGYGLLAALAAAVVGYLADNETPHDHPYAPGGRGRGAAPLSTHRGAISMRGDVHLDGRKVGNFLAGQLAHDLAGPPTGTTGYDFRTSPYANAIIP